MTWRSDGYTGNHVFRVYFSHNEGLGAKSLLPYFVLHFLLYKILKLCSVNTIHSCAFHMEEGYIQKTIVDCECGNVRVLFV